MDDLVAWLGEQYDDEERVAKAMDAKRPGPWRIDPDHDNPLGGAGVLDRNGELVFIARGWYPADYACELDPKRVLAEVAAKRKILAAHQPAGGDCRVCCGEPYLEEHWDGEEETTTWHRADVAWPCLTVRALAEPYAGRPGWREDWRTG